MKKILSLLLALALLLTATACTQQTIAPTTDPTAPTKDPATLDRLYQISTYSANAETVAAARDTVIATLGDAKLTNGLFQMYFWMDVYDFLNNYGSYAIYFGMYYTKPLDTKLEVEGLTWQQYFLDAALKNWQHVQAMYLLSQESGLEISEENKKLILGENAVDFYRFGNLSVPERIINIVE